MKKFTGSEFGLLALGVVLIIGGLIMFVSPRPMVVPHETRGKSGGAPGSLTAMSAGGTRFAGGLGIWLGAGMIALTTYGRKK